MNAKTVDRLILGGLALCFLGLVTLLWFYFFGTKPGVVLAMLCSRKEGRASASAFLGNRQFVALVDDTVYWYVEGKVVWSALLKGDAAVLRRRQSAVSEHFARMQNWSAELSRRRAELKQDKPEAVRAFNAEAAKYTAELRAAQMESKQVAEDLAGSQRRNSSWEDYAESRYAFRNEKFFVLNNAVWVATSRNAVWFNKTNGARIMDIAFPGWARSVEQGGSARYMVSAETQERHVLKISMADGVTEMKSVTPDSSLTDMREVAGRAQNMPHIFRHRSRFLAGAGSLLQMDADLMQVKIMETKGMKPGTANPVSTSTTGWGDGAREVAEIMGNDAQLQSTGGIVRTDNSRYTVTLQHLFATPPIPYWRGDVEGRPEVFLTEHAILLAAGKRLVVFDPATDKIRWEAKLNYPMRNMEWDENRPCCMEDGGRLLVWDTGFLTAFQLANGKVLWRLPSVGIVKVARDDYGMLYVATANLSVEALNFPLQLNLRNPAEPAILKVDAVSGDVLWRAPKFINCFVSGRHIYATREPENPMDLVNSIYTGKTEERFLLHKLNRGSGKVAWQFFEPRAPTAIQVNGRDVLLVFRNGVDLISSWSF